MSESMYGFMFLIVGLIAAALLLFFGSMTSKDERDYYILKEAMQGAMMDSVDDNAYQVGLTQEEVDKNKDSIKCQSGVPGTIRIVKEQFIENFVRRYTDSTRAANGYTIKFYKVQECPPLVSIRVISKESTTFIQRVVGANDDSKKDSFIVNNLSAILESRN